jgi:toxin ParE1/3/4
VPSLRFTSAAQRDVGDIGAYVAEASGNEAVGARMIDMLVGKCEQLASLPGTMGRDRGDLLPGLRSSAFKSYVIFYRYIGNVLEVVNVLEGHRDITAFYHGGE